MQDATPSDSQTTPDPMQAAPPAQTPGQAPEPPATTMAPAPPHTEATLVEPPDYPPLPMRPWYERLLGAATIFGAVIGLFYAMATDRLDDLGDNIQIVIPIAVSAIIGGLALVLPIPVVAELSGLGQKWGQRIRRGRSYAAIIQANNDFEFIPIKGPAVATKSPPALYEVRGGARVRVTKTIRAGCYLTVYNHGNPEPVNDQSIKGWTAGHAHRLVAGALSEAVSGAWAAAVGLKAKLTQKRLLVILGAVVLAYFLFQWYQERFA